MFVGHICLYSYQILDKVHEAMRPHVDKIVNDRLQPYIETIEHTKTTVLAQETVIQQQNQAINNTICLCR
jgi:hypothetical protein